MKSIYRASAKIAVVALVAILLQGLAPFPIHAEDDDEWEEREFKEEHKTKQPVVQEEQSAAISPSSGPSADLQAQASQQVQYQQELESQRVALQARQAALENQKQQQQQLLNQQDQVQQQLDAQKAELEKRQQQLTQDAEALGRFADASVNTCDTGGNPALTSVGQDVEKIDPAFFKDADKDGIPDALDPHPTENEAVYAVKDTNKNGISDDLERVHAVAWR
ncbi:hypothetical protein HYR65_01460 [Candidatus Azambacteria bacterium]|nr:hypothetical protein [Candidatus Azambacteria bacterium]